MRLVIAEQRDGRLNRASIEAITAAQQAGLSRRSGEAAKAEGPLKIVLAGAALDAVAAELAAFEADEVVVVESPALEHYTADGYVTALAALIGAEAPSHVFFPHTYQTRDFAPALAARLQRALITDVTAIHINDGSATYTRPVFQGRWLPTSRPRDRRRI